MNESVKEFEDNAWKAHADELAKSVAEVCADVGDLVAHFGGRGNHLSDDELFAVALGLQRKLNVALGDYWRI